MAVGQRSRPRYQQLARQYQVCSGEVHLTSPPDPIPTRNVPIFVPRQASDPTLTPGPPGTDTGVLSDLPFQTPSPSETPSSSPSQPPSTSTNQPTSTTPPSTQSPSSTPPSTTSRESSLTNSITPSTFSPTPSITPPPPQSFGYLNSSSLTYSPDTTITSPVVVTVNGSATTSYVLIPTTISDSGNTMTSSERTAIIVGSVAGGLVIVILIIAIVLFYRRHQKKKKGFFPASEPKPRTMLLAGEDLDDDYSYSRQTSNAPTPPPSSFRRVESPMSTIPRSNSIDQSPRLLRPRASETGSIFHEGGVWPPPSDGSRLVDPILAGSNINLSGIVDDVMAAHQNVASGSKAAFRSGGGGGDTMTINSEGSIYSTDLPVFVPNPGRGHSRGASANSDVPLIPPEPLYLASTHNSGSSPSIQLPRPESGFDPSTSSTSLSNPHGTRNWLDRSPRKISESPTNPFNRGPSPSSPGHGRLQSL